MVDDGLVETVNALPADQFFARYMSPTCKTSLEQLAEQESLSYSLTTASKLTAQEVQDCLDIVKETSQADYARSEMRWRPKAKRKEMLLLDMKYVILKRTDSTEAEDSPSKVVGFLSFMVTHEDGYEVVYIYEIHIVSKYQGKGFGNMLMNLVEAVSTKIAVCKVMLTVFQSNQKALQWYKLLGYDVDEFSPGPKRLRNGTVKEASYLILSKKLV